MLTKTEAVILKSMKYRDTSKIVTFYTKEYGKIKGIAKGARTAKNKFGSALEPLTHSMLVFYKKRNQELHLISQCDTITSYKKLTEDFDKLTIAFSMIDLVNKVMHEEETNLPIYKLIIETLDAINMSRKNYETYLHAFRLRLAELFGYKPNFEICGKCNKPIIISNAQKQFAVQIIKGAVFCSKCFPVSNNGRQNSEYFIMSTQGLQISRHLMRAQISSLSNLEYDARIGNEIDELLRLYLQCHFDGFKQLKTTKIFH